MKEKVRFSFRMKLTLVLMFLTLGMFVSYFLFNKYMLHDYYLKSKESNLMEVHKQIDKLVGDSEYISLEDTKNIIGLCERYGIAIIIVDNSDNFIFQYGNGMLLRERLQQINFGYNPKDYTLIKSDGNYKLHGYNLSDKGKNAYLEVSGFFNSNMNFLMRMAVESIDESVNISMQFFVRIGFVVFGVGLILIFIISGRFTKPILKLAEISKKMSELNFDIKYKSKNIGKDEIDVLGNSMNDMSDKLESTIVELKQANHELKSDIKKKEQIDEMRRDFIANVSHELKTPIALIQGYAEGLSECVNDDDESREYYCEVICDEAAKMNKMVKNLLSLTQMEFGNLQLNYERFELKYLIEEVINSLNYLIVQNEIELINNINHEVFVYADEYKVEEVVINYLTNAIHYAKNDKKVIVSLEKTKDKARLVVYNSGDNILEEDLQNIWQKFYKVDKARTREYGGNGLGLSIVKAIAEAHNTAYGVKNVENGVEFWYDIEI